MPDNRPRARQEHNVSGGGNVYRKGSGLGTGPVGSGGGFHGGSSGGGGKRAALGGGSTLLVVIIIIAYFLFGGKDSSLLSDTEADGDSYSYTQTQPSGNTGTASSGSTQTSFGNTSGPFAAQNVSQTYTQNTTGAYEADDAVASGARSKRTVLKGNGSDVVTMMVYMCGTDLESKSGMASNDMAEMAQANIADNVNILVYTGGCSSWRTRGISSEVNQIYQISDGGMTRLVDNDGAKKMTDPDTLSGFIRWCAKNYPANRYELIFWDHGGGSVSGFGYDEKFRSAGSMNLSGIKKALTDGGVTFDFVGFDACLMATAETAVMLEDHADYMLASEETEPGIGWYYTNWISKLSRDTSIPTVELGKTIIDDFTNACMAKVNGQKTTLSLIDLAEFNHTVPEKLKNFSQSVSELVTNNEYRTVSDARYQTREFAQNSKIDQVDLANLAENMGTTEGRELAGAIRGAVKYNRTSYNMSNANGVSIYFPYRKTGYVDRAAATFADIGMDPAYTKCIKDAAAMQTSGQIAAGGSGNPLGSLLGTGSSGSYSYGSSDIFGTLLSSFLTDRSVTIDGLDPDEASFLSERSMPDEAIGEYINLNHLDENALTFTVNDEGRYVLKLSEEQWSLIHDVDMNMFYDDGAGYVDLGLDNRFEFDENDDLLAITNGTWFSIGGQIAPYYHTDTVELGDDRYVIAGYVPCLLNGEQAKLFMEFTDEVPFGYITGASYVYRDNETETEAKNLLEVKAGDKLEFICDYYSYDGKYIDSYRIGEPVILAEDTEIGNAYVGDGTKVITYRFTDIYNHQYWTPPIR
ncbi:MAG: peptidase C11 [Lachnospiraceae bacterium]|nr:peptidase C11 [Lachnospiraceae bacterium]